MAALEVLSAWADVDKAVLGEVFNVTVTVKNTTSSDITWAYFILTIDGTTAYMTRGDGFNIGKGKTLTQVFEFPKYDYPKEWTTVMQGVRSSPMYVQASDGYTISEALNIANFEWIDAYYDPQIVQFEAERTPTDESESTKIAIKVSHADSLTDTQIGRLSCELMAYAKDGSTSYNMTIDKTVAELVAGVEITISEDTYKFGKDDDYGLRLDFGDYSESISASIDLPHSFANLHLSGCSTGGACFGGFCKSTEGNPMFECYYPAYFYNGITVGGGSGGKVSITENTILMGFLTGSTKSIYLSVPVTNLSSTVTTGTVTSMVGWVRCAGKYGKSAGYVDGGDDYTSMAEVLNIDHATGTLTLLVTRTTAFNGTNNYPLTFQVKTLEIELA